MNESALGLLSILELGSCMDRGCSAKDARLSAEIHAPVETLCLQANEMKALIRLAAALYSLTEVQ